MLTKVVVIGGALLAGIALYASTKPDTFRYERQTTIKASPDIIFRHINDQHAWQAWSPWEKKDPNMQRSFSGPASGKGAVYEWDGNGQVGKGRSEIIESVPPSKIVFQLDFEQPFKARNLAEFNLHPNGDMTTVTWSMHGPQPLMGKIVSVFMDCEKMVGKDFDNGLASLKAIAEKEQVAR